VKGDLAIVFEGKVSDPYYRNDVSVPLVVAETKLFLARLARHGRATWRVCHAPFLDGVVENGSVRLMSGSKDHDHVVDILRPDDIQNLEAELNHLEDQFGRLKPSPDALDREF